MGGEGGNLYLGQSQLFNLPITAITSVLYETKCVAQCTVSVHCAVQNTNFQNGKNKVGKILNNRPSFCTQMDSGEKEKDRYLSVVKLWEERESHETTVKVTGTPSV